MEIRELKFKGVFEIAPRPRRDDRGFFMRTYDQDIFSRYGLNRPWVQENHARSTRRNIIRGLHLQLPPAAETKLVRVVTGAVLDVFVDLRKGSATFGQWDSLELSAENPKMVFIPRGFAHGYRTLSDISDVLYRVDNPYSPELECGLLWNDGDLQIDWGLTGDEKPVLSVKDQQNLTFRQFCEKYRYIHLDQED